MRKRKTGFGIRFAIPGRATRRATKINPRIRSQINRKTKHTETRETTRRISSKTKKGIRTDYRREVDHSKRFSLKYFFLFFVSLGGIFGSFHFISFLRGLERQKELQKEPGKRVLTRRNSTRTWKYIVIHHSGIQMGDLVRYDRYHREKYQVGLLYHFLIGNGKGHAKNGEIQIGFRWKEQKPGGHVAVEEYNEYGIGICLVGNFEVQQPSKIQMSQLSQLVLSLMKEYSIPLERVFLHREVNSTFCPGRFFPREVFFATLKPLA